MFKKYIITIFIIIPCLYLFLILFLYLNQKNFLFFPKKGGEAPPKELGVNEVFFKTSDGEKLHAWWMFNDSDITVLFFHGNAGNLSSRAYKMQVFKELGLNALMLDYREYGKSSGEIKTENDLYIDAESAWKFLINEKNIKPENIIIWGHSLGAGIAIDLAQDKDIKSAIIESTFYSVEKMAKEQYPWAPISLILKYRFESGEKIMNIKAPLLIIHSKEDEMIPFENGRALFDKAKEPKEFFEINGSHNNWFQVSENMYKKKLKEFIIKK